MEFHQFTGIVGSKGLQLTALDLLDLIFIGNRVQDAENPGKGICQCAVEIENDQFIFHDKYRYPG